MNRMTTRRWLQYGMIAIYILTISCVLMTQYGNAYYCRLDFLKDLMAARNFGLIFLLPILYYISLSFLSDFTVNQVLRRNKKINIWTKQQENILLFALVSSLLWMAVCFLINPGYPVYNWGEQDSMFYYTTQNVSGYSLYATIFLMYGCCVLRIYLLGTVAQTCFWFSNSMILGNVIVAALMVIEMGTGRVRWLSNLYSVDYNTWVSKQSKQLMFLGMVLWGVLLAGCNYYAIRKKEFQNIEKKR